MARTRRRRRRRRRSSSTLSLRATRAPRYSETMTSHVHATTNAPAAKAAGRSLSAEHREWIAGYLFVLPDALGLLIFVGAPMLLSLSLGFFSVSGFGGYEFAGFDNYRRMLADPLFLQS